MIDPQFAESLLERFGSPLYVYDLDEVTRRAKALFEALPARSRVFYSFKANPLPEIAAAARTAGCCGEISSLGELCAALEAGFEPAHLMFGGPGKTHEEIDAALNAGIVRFSCESLIDVRRVHSVAKQRRAKALVLLRVNPAEAPHAKLAMTGVESQFGFEEEILVRQADEVRKLVDHVDVVGVHVYFGTQIGIETLPSTTRSALATAERVSSALRFDCKVVDAGGGFPWPYASAGAGPDLRALAPEYAALVAENAFAGSVELWFESGRYLSAGCGTLLATVLDVKESKGAKKYVVLDTGIQPLGGMSGLGRLPRSYTGIARVGDNTASKLETVDIVGPLCSPLDSMARNVKLPPLAPGDLIAIPNVGAYGLSASLIGFLSHRPPKEIAHRSGAEIRQYQLRCGY